MERSLHDKGAGIVVWEADKKSDKTQPWGDRLFLFFERNEIISIPEDYSPSPNKEKLREEGIRPEARL